MGRMLDALRQRQPVSRQHLIDKPNLRTVWPEENQLDEDQHSESAEPEMPFVEVGGKELLTNEACPKSRDRDQDPPISASWMTVRFRPMSMLGQGSQVRSQFVPELIVLHDPEHPASQQYRELAQSLLLHLPGEQSKVMFFTSTEREAGTTTVLLNFALTLAQKGEHRVLVVDACLKNHAIAQRLGLSNSPGLAEVLEESVPLEKTIQPTGVPNLSVLSAGKVQPHSSRRLAGERMQTLLQSLHQHADLILIDGPIWDGRPAVVALGCRCDAVYVCLPEKAQEQEEVGEMLDIMVEQGAALQGCILTAR